MGIRSDLRVRKAELADIGSLSAAPVDAPASFVRDRLSRQLHGDGLLLVALVENQFVGIAYLWLELAEEPEIRQYLPGVPLLTHLRVHPDFRRMTIGQALVAAVEAEAVRRGCGRLALAVDIDNVVAQQLYRCLQYEYWRHGVVKCENDVELLGTGGFDLCHVMKKTLRDFNPAGRIPVPAPREPAA
ncbi:MAG TPA: GNAT family N-acetyltransferase [Pseudonocardiaceae bacterium]|nr:GNAT family N-acetyltransferase [Pseudonocardiaceae bacterium]